MTEFKIGLMALAAIVAAIFMSLKITQNRSGFGDYVQYRTIVQDAAGIFPKTNIKVAGINKGRILKVELLGNQALVTFEILDDVQLTKNSKLRIKTIGFLGDKYLDIDLGKEAGDPISKNQLIPAIEGAGLEALTKDASEVLKDVKAIVKSIRESVSPKDQETPLKSIVVDIQETASNAKDLTASLKRILEGNEGKINDIIAQIDQLTEQIAYETDANDPQSLVSQMKKVGPVLDDAKLITADLKAVMKNVREGRGTIGKLLNDEQVVDQVTETLAGVKKFVSKVDSIRTELAVFSGHNTRNKNTTDLNLNIYPSPERFYRLGVVTSEFGPTEEKETKTTTGSAITIQSVEETKKDTYTFNAQLGRKIHNFIFRAGLFESTGGIGVDYDWQNYNMRFTAEAFDYEEESGFNLRVKTEFHLWNVIYGRVAAQELITKYRDPSYTFGAGVSFTDEDLKGLLGFFF